MKSITVEVVSDENLRWRLGRFKTFRSSSIEASDTKSSIAPISTSSRSAATGPVCLAAACRKIMQSKTTLCHPNYLCPCLAACTSSRAASKRLTYFDSRYWITIRAEDGRGYLSVSDDGLTYAEQRPWQWDNGELLDMSTTQQHWVNNSSSLYLVYTRKDGSNISVPRWRAPLWISQFDHRSMRLIQSTEQVLLPLIGDGVRDGGKVPMMGNFGVANVSPDETWVTDGSWCPKTNNSGELQIARIRWNLLNRNVLNRNGQ